MGWWNISFCSIGRESDLIGFNGARCEMIRLTPDATPFSHFKNDSLTYRVANSKSGLACATVPGRKYLLSIGGSLVGSPLFSI